MYPNGTGKLNASTELSPEGWPLVDCSVVIFDDRPIGAWAPPIDDPEQRQQNFSGVWSLSLVGRADVSLVSNQGISLGPTHYDAGTNTLTANITIAPGHYPGVSNLLILRFTNTRRNATAPANSGFQHLRVHRPGYGHASKQLFTDDFAAMMRPFDHLRWMGYTGTNAYGWRCGGLNPGGCSVIRWQDRRLPSYAFKDETFCPGCNADISWEEVLLAANELEKDVWINVPVTASAPTVCRTLPTTPPTHGDPHHCLDTDPTLTYEYQLAKLFKDGNEYTQGVGLKPHLRIYVEHSNEVWNFGFPQFSINKAMAEWEVGGAHVTTRFSSP